MIIVLSVELMNGYFVEIDPLNHTLKKRYIGQDKNGISKPSEKVIGYYGNMEQAVKGFVKHNQLDDLGDIRVDFFKYVKLIDEANMRAVKEIKKELKQSEKN